MIIIFYPFHPSFYELFPKNCMHKVRLAFQPFQKPFLPLFFAEVWQVTVVAASR